MMIINKLINDNSNKTEKKPIELELKERFLYHKCLFGNNIQQMQAIKH